MFGMIWYRTKVMRILNDEFAYKPAVPGWQTEVFNSVTRHMKKRGGNEYDGACAFMLVQAASVNGETPESRGFVERVERIAAGLMPRGKLGAEALAEAAMPA